MEVYKRKLNREIIQQILDSFVELTGIRAAYFDIAETNLRGMGPRHASAEQSDNAVNKAIIGKNKPLCAFCESLRVLKDQEDNCIQCDKTAFKIAEQTAKPYIYKQAGLIMGPNYWRRFIKPRMARMYERAKSKGKFISQHSCGDIHELFPDLIEIGLDVYQTFQPEIYDMQKVKKEFGSNLTFWGGISTQRLLPFAAPEQVKEKVRETMKIMSVNGGYIAAPTHAVPADVPPENIVAMLEVFRENLK